MHQKQKMTNFPRFKLWTLVTLLIAFQKKIRLRFTVNKKRRCNFKKTFKYFFTFESKQDKFTTCCKTCMPSSSTNLHVIEPSVFFKCLIWFWLLKSRQNLSYFFGNIISFSRLTVAYFNQLLGACSTQKLVEIYNSQLKNEKWLKVQLTSASAMIKCLIK